MKQPLKIEGFDQIKRTLATLEPKLRNNEMKKGVRAGAALVVKEARKNLPSNLQTLKKSITIKARRGGPKDIKFTITPTKGKNAKYDAWYAHFFEFGTKPHEITAKDKELLGSVSQGIKFGKSAPHPGIPALRFMTRAIYGNEQKILNAIAEKVRTGIKKLQKK